MIDALCTTSVSTPRVLALTIRSECVVALVDSRKWKHMNETIKGMLNLSKVIQLPLSVMPP